MSGAGNAAALQADWENRELIEVVQLNVLQVAHFLNQFDSTMKARLAKLNEKILRLRRSLEYCEEAFKATLGEAAGEG